MERKNKQYTFTNADSGVLGSLRLIQVVDITELWLGNTEATEMGT